MNQARGLIFCPSCFSEYCKYTNATDDIKEEFKYFIDICGLEKEVKNVFIKFQNVKLIKKHKKDIENG